MVKLDIKDLKKEFHHQSVIHHLSLSIRAGEFLVLVGPSGCGKSTLLRMIAGLETPTAGQILWDGKDITHVPPAERNLSMVFQNYSLYPHLSVRDNLSFSLKIKKMPGSEINRRVNEVAELLQLSTYLDRFPRQLSGGQRQRVALGRALVRQTPVILFDEPLSNLDAHLRSQMRAEIKVIHQKTRSTMIYVTHDQVEAMTLGDRIAVLQTGELIQFDDPLKLYREPQNVFVAQFIGTPEINIHDWSILSPDIKGPFFHTLANPPSSLIGIRPEDLRLYAKEGMLPLARGRLVFYENLGSHFLYYLELAPGFIVKTYETPKDFLYLNQEYPLFGKVDRFLYFDPTTKMRLRN